MAEMTIKVEMNSDNKNVIITNDDKSVTITNEKKEINAEDIYSLLKYEEGNTYSVESNLDDINDKNDKEYLNDIVSLIDEIKDEINSLVESKDEDISEIETNNSISDETDDYHEKEEKKLYNEEDFPF